MTTVKRFEEIQVLETKRLANGETWYRVQLRRYPNGSARETLGWVDAKFFTDIDKPVEADQPPRSHSVSRGACTDCFRGTDRQPIPTRQSQDLRDVSQALTRSGFIWPVGGTVRSGFGYRRHPIRGVVRLHKGVDISGNNGSRVRAAKGGTIEVSAGGCVNGRKSCNGGAGNMVTINHGDGTKTRYLHLNPTCRLPARGARVNQGDMIGCVGATGAVTGPHLHFEMMKNGQWINPLTQLATRRPS
ncbi:MAG: M23 family metallopeptidase [Bdellovibrionaceae bacterium]|nr:M23 family metallopeptidase [Pseudobdellovibrionaceae bacterium]